MFFSYCFAADGANVGGKDCVSVFYIGNANGNVFNMLPRTMRSKSAAHGLPTMLYANIAFSVSRISRFVKPSLFSSTLRTNAM